METFLIVTSPFGNATPRHEARETHPLGIIPFHFLPAREFTWLDRRYAFLSSASQGCSYSHAKRNYLLHITHNVMYESVIYLHVSRIMFM